MDGPFMCIDPLPNTDYHLLCNVVHEIHQTNIGKYPTIDKKYIPLLNKGIVKNPEYIKLFGEHNSETLSYYQHRHDHSHNHDGSISK